MFQRANLLYFLSAVFVADLFERYNSLYDSRLIHPMWLSPHQNNYRLYRLLVMVIHIISERKEGNNGET